MFTSHQPHLASSGWNSQGKNTPWEEVMAKILLPWQKYSSRGGQGQITLKRTSGPKKNTHKKHPLEIRSGQKYSLREVRHFVPDSCKLCLLSCFAYLHKMQCTDVMLSLVLFFITLIFCHFWFLILFLFLFCSTLSLQAVHAKYTPGNQQCRSKLQLRTICAGVLHCRSLPSYFKLLYLRNHLSSLNHASVSWNWMEHRMGWFIFRLKFDFDATELTECTYLVFLHLFAIYLQ